MAQPRHRRKRQQGLSTGALVSIIAVSVLFIAGAIGGVIVLVKSRGGRGPVADVVPASGVGIKVGQLAQEIEAEDLDGKRFKLSDYRGKVVVLDFWGNW